MAELLVEIFSEEIPARMQEKAGVDLSKALTNGLKTAGLSVENVTTLTGPRRLVFAANLPVKSPDVSEERKGPRVGAPEQALAGFMRGAGLSDISQAEIRSDKKGDYYVAVIEKSGLATADILSELIPSILNSFPWPKSMKSGATTFRWVRPLQSMICLLDGEVVDFEVGGVKTGCVTHGHRRHGAGPLRVSGFADYRAQLEGAKPGQGHVMLGADARKAKIMSDATRLCQEAGLELVEDIGLLNEVAGLAEWPVVILGDMDPTFLQLPDEVIRLTLKSHQKTFTVRDPKTGTLAPHFIIIANQVAPDGGETIKKGNAKVISARLSDAQFFQTEDAKNKLEDYYDKLDTVVFHKKLGSIKDKAERVAALARELAPMVGADADKAEQAARLAKCDLVTQTVIEFTSLQGQIGALMYQREGGDPDVATAIEQHYKPQGPSDSVPTQPVAVAVALADKLDSLVGFWAIDEKPTGSKDPYALRRAALGVVRMILENEVRGLQLENRLGLCLRNIVSDVTPPEQKTTDLLAFIADRLKVYLRDAGVRHDLIDAVFARGEDDLVAIVNRVDALQEFLGTESGGNLLAGYKRAANILRAEAKKGEIPTGAPTRPVQDEARALFEALEHATPEIEAALAREAFSEAMTALSSLRGPIDSFFTHVTVNDEDADVRDNHLKLLNLIRETAHRVADFDKIEG